MVPGNISIQNHSFSSTVSVKNGSTIPIHFIRKCFDSAIAAKANPLAGMQAITSALNLHHSDMDGISFRIGWSEFSENYFSHHLSFPME
jgi:hypothetical protein